MSNSTTINDNGFTFSSGGENKTITVDVPNGVIDFGNMELRGSAFSTQQQQVIGVGGGGGLGVGAIDTYTILEAGNQFGANEVGSFHAKTGSGSGGGFNNTQVDSNGGLLDFDITSGGSGYAVNDEVFLGDAESGTIRPYIRVDSIE